MRASGYDKAVCYYRVSTSKQGADGIGIDAQKKACLDYLNGGNLKVVGEFTEVESGAKNKRPQLESALALCDKEKATLLVAKLDRLSRSMYFVARLMESGIKFVCADQPYVSNFTVHILAAAAQYEREQIQARVKSAQAVMKRHIAKTGFHVTKEKKHMKKLGSKNWDTVQKAGRANRISAANMIAMNIYPTIEQCRKLGLTSMRQIAEELTNRKIETPARQKKIDKGIPVYGEIGSKNGPKWHPQQVKLVIDRVKKEGKNDV